MTRKNPPIISLAILLVGLTPLIQSGIPPIVKPPSILKEILTEVQANNSQICPTPKEILESKYVKTCDSFPFPPANTTLSGHHDEFLCLALYDRAFQICHHAAFGIKIPELRNRSAFDALIAVETKNVENQVDKICESFKDSPAAILTKTKTFVDALMVKLKDKLDCYAICYISDPKALNPLCVVISAIDEEIRKESKIKVEKPTEAVKVKAAPKEIAKIQAKSETVTKMGPATSKVESNPSGTGGKGSGDHQAPPKSEPQPPSAKGEDKTKGKVEAAKGNSEKEQSATQEQPPPIVVEEKKGLETEKVQKEGNSPSQIGPPGKEAPGQDAEAEEEKSTVSENTADGDADNYLTANEGADLDAGEDPVNLPAKNSPPEKPIQEPIPRNPDESPNLVPIADDDSHFFGYFTLFGLFGIGLFAAYHHKHKIFAMLLEGRRSRGGRGRRRPSTANYRKLDANLEEAVTSQCSSNVTHVIY